MLIGSTMECSNNAPSVDGDMRATKSMWACVFDPIRALTDYDPGGICGGPLFAPPSTSARVQSRFEFVELGGDMCSNYRGEGPAGTGITGWYQLVPRTIC